jgi:hypothetical protein
MGITLLQELCHVDDILSIHAVFSVDLLIHIEYIFSVYFLPLFTIKLSLPLRHRGIFATISIQLQQIEDSEAKATRLTLNHLSRYLQHHSFNMARGKVRRGYTMWMSMLCWW